MSEPSNRRFWSFHVNGRARFALAAALLVPPVSVALNVAWTDAELEWVLVALLWALFAFGSLLFAYIVLGVGRLLAWVRDGMTDPEWRAAKAGTWMLFVVMAVTAGGVVAISKFQDSKRPETHCCANSCQKLRMAPTWHASTNGKTAIHGLGSATRI